MRTDLGDGLGVIDLCEAVLSEARRVVPKVRLMALQQQAHGASLTGDRHAVDQLIGEADRVLVLVDDDLPWGNACRRTPGYLEVQRATCYGRLGADADANGLWAQVLEAVPRTARRDQGVYLARYATSAAASGHPDQALELVRKAAAIAAETRSARMLRELSAVRRAMEPWLDTSVGRDLDDALAPVSERG
ncbi:hypothetical protein SRB5_22450 [Streptomyces sp. RB5]|uniref:Uncharacterized protein n=1 Tax=Streptomyces smaragdinus TaxID=2585196 RepID=A0A7K0CF67_9ACTN|nr:hypothetical protein [Streptomyces smaragdinus]MQY12115.1 hypothetical protein [Streptomyces smaragdinus]